MIHAPRLWLRKVDDTFAIIKYDKTETLDELNNEGRLQTKYTMREDYKPKYIERKNTQDNTCITHQTNQTM